MKKALGPLVLTLSFLVMSAGCASSGRSSNKPERTQAAPGENWAKAGFAEVPNHPTSSARLSAARR
jgi:hypothetical protein